MKLGLASNFYNEEANIPEIWNIFKDVVDQWTVVDSGSTDRTKEVLHELVGDKLNWVESDMLCKHGYGYARTKLLELSKGMDWVLIFDGDERMLDKDVRKLKSLILHYKDSDLIWLPRCNYLDKDMLLLKCDDKVVSNYEEAINIKPDWQPRLVKRTITDGKSKVNYIRKVHELVQGAEGEVRDLENPVIHHFSLLKPYYKQKAVYDLCTQLWKQDVKYESTYVLENSRGYIVRNPDNKGI